MAEKLIGRVTHYFDKISVGVIHLATKLKVGDKIKVQGGGKEFEQVVESLQMDKEAIKVGKKGQEVGLKMEGKARDGYRVYKVK